MKLSYGLLEMWERHKIQRSEAQKHILETTLKEHRLLQSRILSSLEPKVGREFNYEDLDNRERKIN